MQSSSSQVPAGRSRLGHSRQGTPTRGTQGSFYPAGGGKDRTVPGRQGDWQGKLCRQADGSQAHHSSSSRLAGKCQDGSGVGRQPTDGRCVQLQRAALGCCCTAWVRCWWLAAAQPQEYLKHSASAAVSPLALQSLSANAACLTRHKNVLVLRHERDATGSSVSPNAGAMCAEEEVITSTVLLAPCLRHWGP